MIGALHFQTQEEALHDGIVPAITLAEDFKITETSQLIDFAS